ncbi:Uncharacterised protein [Halioglobus japonicus]|nr:Uncharacterised protein [Halioglobus japonicus]
MVHVRNLTPPYSNLNSRIHGGMPFSYIGTHSVGKQAGNKESDPLILDIHLDIHG